jgi:hypothetical protein
MEKGASQSEPVSELLNMLDSVFGLLNMLDSVSELLGSGKSSARGS